MVTMVTMVTMACLKLGKGSRTMMSASVDCSLIQNDV